jgi:CRISPR-associated protein (TIGR03984 family)
MKTCNLQTTPVTVERGDPHTSLVRVLPEDAYVVEELTDAVRIGRLGDSNPEWKKIIRIRAFHPDRGQVLLERDGERLRGRTLLETSEGERCWAREGQTLCFGEVTHARPDGVTMGEERVASYDLPITAEEEDNIILHHRDYIRFDDDGVARIFASRAVDFSRRSSN